jgi:hypothetical protein
VKSTFKRALRPVVALFAVVVFSVSLATPASAATHSTTGASGRDAYLGYSLYDLFARDTLTDTHCARWQRRAPGGSWAWTGESVCTASEQLAATGFSGWSIRICRTGVGNCSSAYTLP